MGAQVNERRNRGKGSNGALQSGSRSDCDFGEEVVVSDAESKYRLGLIRAGMPWTRAEKTGSQGGKHAHLGHGVEGIDGEGRRRVDNSLLEIKAKLDN